MTHTQQTTREVLEQASARALKLHNDHWMHWSDDDIANSNENLSLFRAMLAHPSPSTTGEAEGPKFEDNTFSNEPIPIVFTLYGTAPQVEPAPNPEQALQRLSELGQQLQPEEFEAPKRPPNCGTGHCSCIECVMEPAPSTAGERDAKPMTAHRAVYFMERFKREEKLLGPNEQAAIDYVIALLQSTADHIPDALAGKVGGSNAKS